MSELDKLNELKRERRDVLVWLQDDIEARMQYKWDSMDMSHRDVSLKTNMAKLFIMDDKIKQQTLRVIREHSEARNKEK